MGVFNGTMTVRRYLVEGEVPDDFRDRFTESLEQFAFREPRQWEVGEAVHGWCLIHNLLDTDFTRMDRWLYNHYVTAALRIDKKALPAKYFKAHLEKRIQQWCAENHREKAPAAVKREQKELLEQEFLVRTLPRVATYEFVWNLLDGWVAFHNTGEGPNDLFRTLFRNTFGLVLTPISPLDLLGDLPQVVEGLETAGISDYRPRGAPEGL